MENKRYTFEDAVNKFEQAGYILLSTKDEYKNVSTKLRYICPKHSDKGEMLISLGHLNDNRGCYYCGRERTENAHKKDLSNFEETDRKLCEKNNFEYVSTERINISGKNKICIKFICNRHRNLGIQYMVRSNMKREIKGCKFCSGKKLPTWYVLEKIHQANPNIEIIDKFGKLTDKVTYKCVKHNLISKTSIQELIKGCCCVECGKEKLAEYHTLSFDEYSNKVSEKKPTIEVINYIGMKEYATFRCRKCGHIWDSNAAYMVNSKYGRQCPNCESFYYGEKEICDFLDNHKISYIQQFRFDDCRNIRPLPFDFYLPDFNICIEFDGRQHYFQRKGWSDLETVQNNDKIKNAYCTSNNIPLIRVPFWESDNMEYFYIKN